MSAEEGEVVTQKEQPARNHKEMSATGDMGAPPQVFMAVEQKRKGYPVPVVYFTTEIIRE